jgi:hypothetical protein
MDERFLTAISKGALMLISSIAWIRSMIPWSRRRVPSEPGVVDEAVKASEA